MFVKCNLLGSTDEVEDGSVSVRSVTFSPLLFPTRVLKRKSRIGHSTRVIKNEYKTTGLRSSCLLIVPWLFTWEIDPCNKPIRLVYQISICSFSLIYNSLFLVREDGNEVSDYLLFNESSSFDFLSFWITQKSWFYSVLTFLIQV